MSKLPFKSSIYGIERINTGDERADNRANYLIMSLGYMSLCASAYSFIEETKQNKFEAIRLGKFSLEPQAEDADNKRLMSIGCKLAACDYCYETIESCDMSFRYYPTFATLFVEASTRARVVKAITKNPRLTCHEALSQNAEQIKPKIKPKLIVPKLTLFDLDNIDK